MLASMAPPGTGVERTSTVTAEAAGEGSERAGQDIEREITSPGPVLSWIAAPENLLYY